jgi:thioredoxin reductase
VNEASIGRPDVLVVGGGPAGLTAAATISGSSNLDVLVLEREHEAGGIPRHSDHTGYGIRDLRRLMRGPAYARLLAERARDAGARVLTESMATGWSLTGGLEVTSPRGRVTVEASAVVLATGARERPRPARRIPGDRPQGVYTTGQLQNLVHLHRRHVGRRAVVVGSELVSWSAVMTLRHAGCQTALMTSQYEGTEAYAAFSIPGRLVLGVDVAHRTRVVRVIGKRRVEAVEIEDLDDGRRRLVSCDTVVFTGDWIPDHELARTGGLDMDPASLAPVVDRALRTSRPGVFAAGNLLHAVDTADVAAIDGRHVAAQVVRWLDRRDPLSDGISLVADAPFRWVTPALLRPDEPAPPRNRLLLWPERYLRLPTVFLVQDGKVLTKKRLPWPVAPGRVFRVPAQVLDGVDPFGGPVRIGAQ